MQQMNRLAPAFLLVLALTLVGGCTSESHVGDTSPPRGVEYYVAGMKAYRAGDQKTAQARFEQATSVNPNLRMARSMLGDMYRAQGQYERAREQYEILVRLDPYDPENHYRLGVTYQFLRKIQDAIASYLRASTLSRATCGRA